MTQSRLAALLARKCFSRLTLGAREALAIDDDTGRNGNRRAAMPLECPSEDDVSSQLGRHGPPVFISGCCRGGTSILAHLLSHHPELSSVGRGQYHEASWVWNQRFRDRTHHRWAVEPWLKSMRKTAADVTPDLLAYFRHTYSEACDGGRMLEKTPANAVRLPFIHGIYPDCYIIHIVRDGRHTAASLMARRVKLAHAARQWVGAHEVALTDIQQLGTPRATVVHFEDLICSPVQTLLGICRHCELSDSGVARERLSHAVQSHLKSPRDRWSELREADRRQVLSVIEELQARLGYPVET